MVSSERYVLKHFYYGQFVKEGEPGGDLRLLAQTHGLSNELVEEALQIGLIPPRQGTNDGSWAIVRGKKEIPFLLIESEVGKSGQPMLHYIVLPTEALRSLGGNLRLLDPLITGDMPSYDRVGNVLKPLVLSDVRPADDDQEINDILDLMTFAKNRLEIMEGLLAGIIQGIPVIIRNAPGSPEQRLTLITGLLALLPPSVRFAVTFATHTLNTTPLDVQIRFMEGNDPGPENAVQYDWKTGSITGKPEKDSYSHFIISQLRLDTEQVIKQTRRLTSVASWRIKQGDRLAVALGYASNRMSMDDAVMNSQPVEAADVSRVLATDPTLSDELRVAYARHLMNFSLALGQLDHAEPLGLMLRSNAELSHLAHEALKDALMRGAGGDIFDLLAKWLANPLGPQGQQWIDLAHESAITYINDVIDDGDLEEVVNFLMDVDKAGVTVVADQLIPKLLRVTLPLATMDTHLAHVSMYIGCKYLSVDAIQQMLGNPQYLERMPDGTKTFVQALQSNVGKPRLLKEAAAGFESNQLWIFVRFVELTMKLGRMSLIDEDALRQLVKAASTDLGQIYPHVFLGVVRTFSDENTLRRLGEPSTTLLLGILLAMQSYDELVTKMIDQSRWLYPGDKQNDYARMIRQLFAETPMPEEEVPNALDTLSEGGIRFLPLFMAFIGTLESHRPSEIMDALAGDATDLLCDTPRVADVAPVDSVTSLLRYHIRKGDVEEITRIMGILPLVAARYGERSVSIMGKVYKQLVTNESIASHCLNMLRRYIRYSEQSVAKKSVDALGKALGAEVLSALEATYVLKLIMDDRDIITYSEMLETLASFLHDTTEAYNFRKTPTEGAILNDLDSMPGGLRPNEKQKIAQDIIEAGRAAYELGSRHNKVRGSETDRRIDGLLKAEVDPQSALEIMRVMGGYLAQGKRFRVDLREQQHPHPLPRRTAQSFMDEVKVVNHLLNGTVNALPDGGTVSAKQIYDEMDSIWNSVPLDRQREIVTDLAQNLQQIAEILPMIASKGDGKVLEDSGLGKRLEANKARPRNVLEFYRFVAGYYLQRV